MTTLHVSYEELCGRVSATLEKAGLRDADARTVAENLVEAEARDLGSHGLLLLPVYVRRILAGGIRAEYAVTLVNDGGAAVLLDGGGGPGQAVARHAMAMAVARAKSAGVSWVTVRNTNHIGMMTSYAMQAVEQGLIGIVMSNTSRAVAPYGGVGRRIGTNPICIAVPTLDDPFMLDIATTTVSNGRVKLAALRGEPIAPDWITDADGEPTVDPTVLDRGGHLTPLGGHKGYGLAVAIDLLTGILGGGPSSAEVTSQIAHPESCVRATQTFIALDPEALGGRTSVCAAAHSYLAMLRDTPPLRADSPVLVPGDLEAAALRVARARGVELTRPIVGALSESEQMVRHSPATASAVSQEAAC